GELHAGRGDDTLIAFPRALNEGAHLIDVFGTAEVALDVQLHGATAAARAAQASAKPLTACLGSRVTGLRLLASTDLRRIRLFGSPFRLWPLPRFDLGIGQRHRRSLRCGRSVNRLGLLWLRGLHLSRADLSQPAGLRPRRTAQTNSHDRPR